MATATASIPAGNTSQRSTTRAAAVSAAVERHSRQDYGHVRKHANQAWLGVMVLLLHAAMHGVEAVQSRRNLPRLLTVAWAGGTGSR